MDAPGEGRDDAPAVSAGLAEAVAAVAAAAGSSDRGTIVATLTALVEPLARAMPGQAEVVVHDLARVPHSIVAISGHVTGRKVGDPPTDVLLQQVAQGLQDYNLNYDQRLPDGRLMRSSTMLLRDGGGVPVAALCIHVDMSPWLAVHELATAFVEPGGDPGAEPAAGAPDPAEPAALAPVEVFPHDVNELAGHLLRAALTRAQVPLERMKKRHKLEVVRELQERGFFLLRDAVDMAADALVVSRFTIYNYLSEITADVDA